MIRIREATPAIGALSTLALMAAVVVLEWLTPNALRARAGQAVRAVCDGARQAADAIKSAPSRSSAVSRKALGFFPSGGGQRTRPKAALPAAPLGLDGQFELHRARVRAHLERTDKARAAHETATRKIDAMERPLETLRADVDALVALLPVDSRAPIPTAPAEPHEPKATPTIAA